MCVCVDLSDGWSAGRADLHICIYYKLYLYVWSVELNERLSNRHNFLFSIHFFFRFVACALNETIRQQQRQQKEK